MNAAGLHGKQRRDLWAEAANYETETTNLLVSRKDKPNSYEQFYGSKPRYANDLQPFGRIGIAKRNDSGFLSKITNKGVSCMMLG